MTIDHPTRYWNGMTIPDAGTFLLDEAHKRVGFLGKHMMVSPVRGELTRASATIVVGADPLASAVSATMDATSLTTHHDERDVHLRSPDFLDVERFPTVDFRSTSVRWQGPQDDAMLSWARLRNRSPERSEVPAARIQGAGAGHFVVSGLLTIRDVTLPIDLTMQFGGARRDPYGRDIFGFSASGTFDREAYGLVWNVVLETGGLLVGKKVEIEIAGEAIRQD
ncbi:MULTISPECIES: YceI family protein [Oerskovia]|uniref:YceI family protein n=1 Tax=Oerskovia merdavium TaxID=2762227 RepID=A0ABR8U0C3_9CELL|nr:YceI family protein [Oerskovia merdavium]MBD7981459.1 YceI family protein [Oerskovia merdavium]